MLVVVVFVSCSAVLIYGPWHHQKMSILGVSVLHPCTTPGSRLSYAFQFCPKNTRALKKAERRIGRVEKNIITLT